jgi:hypothetical protein
VTSIGDAAFGGCTGVAAFAVDTENAVYSSSEGVLFNKSKSIIIQYPPKKVGSYSIPNSVTSIKGAAFEGSTGLTSVTIPNSVKSIEWSAFWGCTGLTSVTIPNSVTSIGEMAFGGCKGLTSVTIPDSVTSIGFAAFSNYTKVIRGQPITLPNTETSQLSAKPSSDELRSWTDASGGFKTKATYKGIAGGNVSLLKTTGETITIPFERLSADDQKWVKAVEGEP